MTVKTKDIDENAVWAALDSGTIDAILVSVNLGMYEL